MKHSIHWLSALLFFVFVSLAVSAEPADPAPSEGGRAVTIKNMQYTPAKIEVKVGQTVVWNNRDDRDHTVIATDKSFNSGNIRSGTSFSHTFTKAGTYPYGCEYHPRMKGTVVVKQ